ncbi:MAG TPA: hypothetical protein P5560_02245 [Thermotogota bacterium]|nr:hypothetical protein [Thermotogota bacterium]HRW91749.1 hypothetical protein [Thermotogota bacterium]
MRYGVLFPGELLNPGSVLLVKRAGVDFLLGFDPVPGGSLESLLLQSVVFDAEVPLLYGFSRQGRWKFWFFSPGAPGRVCQKEILSCPFSLSIEIPQR